MKLNKNVLAISLGTAMLMAMVIIVSMISVPKAPPVVNTADKAPSLILAAAHSLAAPQTNVAAAGATKPLSIPVPCPIWILGQIAGIGTTANQSADGAPPSVEMVPGGIWFMQKFSEVVRKAI